MNISRFFIERPIFASVIAIFIVLIGAFSYPQLSLSQYPEIAPPTINVSAFFPGASAETMANTVATPLEQEINGVEDMLYMSSSSTSSGQATITVTFKPGTDLDAAQVLVQNRVAVAEPRLPEQVRQIGVTVAKQATGFLMFVALTSSDPNHNIDYVGNYATSVLRDRLLRIKGVGGVMVFGGGNYAMRVWIDPDRAAARNLTAGEIVGALRTQNVQVAGGAVGQPPYGSGNPAFQLPIEVQGRLSDPAQFADVIIKTEPSGAVTRIRDVGRVELASQEYGVQASFRGDRGIALGIAQQPGSNALDAAELVIAQMDAAAKEFPPGMSYVIPYNPTKYVAASVDAVQETLLEAIVLVVLVILVFLQTWRAAIIPILAIPVALIGTFAVQLALGFSINSLSLFALVLAVGIVVDDAIVVVEAVEKHIRNGMTPREAAHRTMREVSGALIAIGLVLTAVFVPTAFIPGIPGIFYRQFAVTIASASLISLIVSLTLSPALAALLLKPHREHDADEARGWMRPVRVGAAKFNAGFDWLSDRYGQLTGRVVRKATVMLGIYAGLLALTGWQIMATPTGFIPEQDQGALIGVFQLPPGSSLERTSALLAQADKIATATEGVEGTAYLAGVDGASYSLASNSGTMFVHLKDWGERKGQGQSAHELSAALTGKMAGALQGANIFFLAPPAVPGLGTGNGFMMMLQDRSGAGYRALEGLTFQMMGAAAQTPEVTQVFSLFNTGSPRIRADVDRDRAQLLGVQPAQIFEALGTYLGSTYVNDFNLLGRTFRVTAQAEPSSRDDLADVGRLQVRSSSGAMVPLSSVATFHSDSGPTRVVRYNLYPAVELQGQTAPGVSSGTALAAMEGLAAKTLPPGITYEWTGLAYQQKAAESSAVLVFLLAVLFVFLVLAAQYEAITLPLAVILIVPMCILAALFGLTLRGMDNNILAQIGLVVLVALAAKNAILIVEFAKQAEEEHGMSPAEAAVNAAGTRLRPILMTSFAFIFGVIPLAIAVGPGAEMRQTLGTAVIFGMLGVTLFGLIFTPLFYVVSRSLGRFLPKRPPKEAVYPTSYGGTPHDPLTGDSQ